jgi:hypothetical protein
MASQRDNKVFYKNQSKRGFESSFQNCFWNLSEKTSWSLKTSFRMKICKINSKTVMKNFFHVRLTCKSLNFMVLGYPSKETKTIFEFVG